MVVPGEKARDDRLFRNPTGCVLPFTLASQLFMQNLPAFRFGAPADRTCALKGYLCHRTCVLSG